MRVLPVIFFCIALPLQAEDAEDLELLRAFHQACQDGNSQACTDYELIKERHPDYIIPTETDPSPVDYRSPDQIPARGHDWPVWIWAVTAVLGFFIATRFFRAFSQSFGAPPAKRLDRPQIRPGQRTQQGALFMDEFDTQQIVPWDTGRVMQWLDDEEQRLRPLVENPKVLELADLGETLMVPNIGRRFVLSEYMYTEGPEGRLDTEPTNDSRFAQVYATKRGMTGAGCELAVMAWQEDWLADDRMVYDLMRLSADQDFNPAAIAMQAYINRRDHLPEHWYDRDVVEAYLHHFFDLGAPDGHFQIADTLATFYLWNSRKRDDHGYFAAAMDRVKSYDRMTYRQLMDRFETHKRKRDLNNMSVDREGYMMTMLQNAERPMH